jgi:homoserine kinase
MVTSAQAFRIPASTSNLGSGFDALSLAVSRYLEVSFARSDAFAIEASGVNAVSIPLTADNLVQRVAFHVARKRDRELSPFRLRIANHIPLARGLGSSAAAIIAGITCYEWIAEDRLTDDEIFRYAHEFEPHPDNLAASLYGGLIAAATSTSGETYVARLTIAGGAAAVAVVPEFELYTAKARAVLPAAHSHSDAVYNIQRSALTIAALTTGKWSLLREAMRDRIHQPYRAQLIPGLAEILEMSLPGLMAVALSGAGPTVFAFTEPAQAHAIGMEIARTFLRFGVTATPHVLEIDTAGRTAM